MADNAPVGATTVAADELDFVNGVEQSEPKPKAQRVRPVHGPDGNVQDTSIDAPLPVTAADVVAAIQALQASPTALDPASLSALESITAALEPGTLAALEQITATLDAGTLAGLAGAATPANLPGASGAITAVDGRLMGLSVREAAGTPAKASMRLRAGSVSGAVLATVTLAPEESIRDWFGPNGITATGGVYYELVSGTITGGVQTR